MRAKSMWLAEAEKQLIFEDALLVLERVGIGLSGSRVLQIMSDHGARVDHKTGIVRIPAELVAAALAQCPRQILLAGLSPDQDVLLDDGRTHFCTGGCAARLVDMDSGEVRASTLEDVRQVAAVCDEVDEVSVLYTPLSATDLPEERRELLEYLTLLEENAKHQVFVNSPQKASELIHIAEILSGDLERFRERPRFTTLCTVASPLNVDGRLLDFHAEMAAIGAPVGIFPAPLCGANAPVTVAGTVAQTLAEFLGAATAIQLMAPGARIIMGSIGNVLDMRTAIATFASPEAATIGSLGVQLGHYLGLPVQCAGLASSANYTGVQAGYEKALKALLAALAGADMISGGIGLLESANLLYLPQVLIDAEIAAMIMRLKDGAEVTHETVMVDAIERVGVGGDFLHEKETSRRLRSGEHFAPQIATRLPHGAWQARGQTEAQTAAQNVREILARRVGREPYLSGEQRQEIEDLIVAG